MMLLISHSIILAVVWTISFSSGQELEYFCNNVTSDSATTDFHITVLLNQHYGPNCDLANPRLQGSSSYSGGVRVVDTCGDNSIATKAIIESTPYSWLQTDSSTSNDVCSTKQEQSTNIGYISETAPVTEEVLVLTDADLPLIVTSDYDTQTNMSASTTFYVGNSMQMTIQRMAMLMVELDWDYLTVVHSDDAYGEMSLDVFKKISMEHYICIDKVISVSSESLSDELASSAPVGVVYLGSEGAGLKFIRELTSSSKVIIISLDVTGVRQGAGKPVVYSVIPEPTGTHTVQNALTALGEAANTALTGACPSLGDRQTCLQSKAFRAQLMTELTTKVQSYAPAVLNYEAWEHGNTKKKVATISAESVGKLAGFKTQKSHCTGVSCHAKCGLDYTDDYLYIPGQYNIIVTLPIHAGGSSSDPYKCESLEISGLYKTVAATYAFNQLKSQLSGFDFGMLIIDSCVNKLKTASDIFDILRGERRFCQRNGGACMDHTKIVAVVGDFSSGVTKQVQTILREIPVLQVSYGATSVSLNNREDYPYFLRTVPPDDRQAQYMVSLLEWLIDEGNDINAVNLLYTDGLYGRTGIEAVKAALGKTKICVHHEDKFKESANTRQEFVDVMNRMIDRAGDARIIIVFADPKHVTDFMDIIQDPVHLLRWQDQGFHFILSDTWSNNEDYLKKYGQKVAAGSFSISFNSDFQSTTVDPSLASVTLPKMTDENPWMSTLWQEDQKCKIRGNFESIYQRPCDQSSRPDFSKLTKEAYSVHLMKSITAVVYGIRKYNTDISEEEVFSADTIQERYNQLLQLEMPSELESLTKDIKPFTQATNPGETYGNGKVGYTIHNIHLDGTTPKYADIFRTGSDATPDLGEFKDSIKFYQGGQYRSKIASTSESDYCLGLRSTPKPESVAAVSDDGQNQNLGLIIGMGVMAAVIVIIIILSVLCFIHYKRRSRAPPRNGHHDPLPMAPRQSTGADYEELPYGTYMDPRQRSALRKFVNNSSDVVPPEYHIASGGLEAGSYDNHVEDPYNVPRNNAEVGSGGHTNPAFTPSVVGVPGSNTEQSEKASNSSAGTLGGTFNRPRSNTPSTSSATKPAPTPAPRSNYSSATELGLKSSDQETTATAADKPVTVPIDEEASDISAELTN